MTDKYHQESHETREERFPKIYNAAKKLKPNARRILSFGCSTGPEVQALAKRFPNAEIVGVDIDHYSIQQARRNNKLPNVSFHDELSGLGEFDLVTVLMVLFSMRSPIPEDSFKSTLAKIDQHINPGGVVMVYTADHPILGTGLDPCKYKALNEWTRVHNVNHKTYYCGYYRKRRWYNIF